MYFFVPDFLYICYLLVITGLHLDLWSIMFRPLFPLKSKKSLLNPEKKKIFLDFDNPVFQL